jgi:trimethylamine---corrinoid protein Co-methyltransferase
MHTSILSARDQEAIHDASMLILRDVGVEIPHAEALSLLQGLGARVDEHRNRAFLPERAVRQALEQAGKAFRIRGVDERKEARFGEGGRNYNSIAGEAHVVDEPGALRRPATLADVGAAARVAEGLEQLNIAGGMADPADVPVAIRPLEVFRVLVSNTRKPVHLWFSDRASTAYLMEMLQAVRGSAQAAGESPLCYAFLEPISPLRFAHDGIDILFETRALNMPVSVGPMAQMGLSAPCSIPATLAQENAEILAGICVVQAISPGACVCYGGICHAFDMRTTQMIFGGPEQVIFGVAMTEMGKRYGLPVYINVGLTDSKLPDAQAGTEAAATLVAGAAAGADVFGHMGIAGVDQASSLDMLVLQHEVIRYVESVMREVRVSPETLAVSEVMQAGPGGNHIGTEHTASRFRDELWFPRIFDRSYYDAWRAGGAADVASRCRHEKERLLAVEQPPVLAEDTAAELDKIIEQARRRLVSP